MTQRDKFTWFAGDLIVNRVILAGTVQQMLPVLRIYMAADGFHPVEVEVATQLVLRAQTQEEAVYIVNGLYPVIT